MKKLILLACSLSSVGFSSAQPLEKHEWEHRVILLFAASGADEQLQQQYDLLTAHPEEVTERDLKIYRVFPEYALAPGGERRGSRFSESLCRIYETNPRSGFTFLLIGKDGTEKLRSETVVSLEKLFSLIDSMPMRKAEMRRRN